MKKTCIQAVVGENATVTFETKTGSVKLYSSGGRLWRDWLERAGINRKEVVSIQVVNGEVHLPEDARGFVRSGVYTTFGGLINAQWIDLNGFNTSKVKDMSFMFSEDYRLVSADFSGLNTSYVTTMKGMFSHCHDIKHIKGIQTNRTTDMTGMFYECRKLTDPGIQNFDTSNVTLMGRMFYDCSSLKELDLSRWNTAGVINTSYMFYHCRELIRLDLRNFNTSKITDMQNMFAECQNLKQITMNTVIDANVRTEGIFGDCHAEVIQE